MPFHPEYKYTELMAYIERMKSDNKSFKYTSVLYECEEREFYTTIQDGTGDDIVIEASMDNNIVLHVCAYSKMMKGYGVDENYTIKTPPAEIYKMCFGLEIER